MSTIVTAVRDFDDELEFAEAELRQRLADVSAGSDVFYDLGEFEPCVTASKVIDDDNVIDAEKVAVPAVIEHKPVDSNRFLTVQLKPRKLLQWALVGSLLPLNGVGLQGVIAQTLETPRSTSTKNWYLGGGLGISSLEPDSFTNAITIDDENDLAFNLYAGIDISKRFAVEAQYANLGEAGVAFLGESVGSVDYEVAGVSGLLYLFDSSGMSGNRAVDGGLSLYLKAGVGTLINDSELDFIQNNDVQFWIGAGLQLGFDNGWAVRAEVNSFDTDARQLTASLVKRFAFGDQYAAAAPIPVPETVVTPVVDPEPEPVALPDLALKTVYFGFDQTDIDQKTRDQLDQIVQQLADYPEVYIVLTGHTDWIGSQNYNSVLSLNRAASVRDYLVEQSIAAERIEVEGLGELLPVADNQTESGRALNRRVDIALRLN